MLPGNSQSVQMLPSSSTNRVGFLSFAPLLADESLSQRRHAGRIPLL